MLAKMFNNPPSDQLRSSKPRQAKSMLLFALLGALLLLGPALLKSRLGVDEVVTTLLLNFIVLLFVSMMLDGPMKDNYRALAFIAQTMVSPQSKIDGLDMGVALKAAEQAVKLTNEKDAKVLEVLASVHFAKGDVAKAIEVQKKAVALDPKLQKTLDEYEAAAKK